MKNQNFINCAVGFVFSDGGLIMTAKRTSMKEDLFEALVFLKRNGGIVGKMFNLSKEN